MSKQLNDPEISPNFIAFFKLAIAIDKKFSRGSQRRLIKEAVANIKTEEEAREYISLVQEQLKQRTRFYHWKNSPAATLLKKRGKD